MRRVSLSLLVLFLASCEGTTVEPVEFRRPDISVWVTPQLALELGPDGRFLPVPAEAPPFSIIDESTAVALAEAWAVTQGPFYANLLRQHLGAPVPFDRLRALDIFIGQTPYEPFEAPDAHPAVQRGLGPYYLVLLGDDQRIWISLAVSALNHHLTLENGIIHYPVYQGAEFLHTPATADFRLHTVEKAVEEVAQRFGARVARRPVFLLGPSVGREAVAPQLGTWMIELDRPVTVERAGGARLQTSIIHATPYGRLLVPETTQPDAEYLRHPTMTPGVHAETWVQRRADRPTRFVDVTDR